MTVAPLDSPTKIPLAAGSVYRCRHLPPTELLFRQSALRSPHPLHYIIVEKGPEQNREKEQEQLLPDDSRYDLVLFPYNIFCLLLCYLCICFHINMPFENLYFYDDSIISTKPFKRAILSTSKVRKNPGWWKHPGSLSAPG